MTKKFIFCVVFFFSLLLGSSSVFAQREARGKLDTVDKWCIPDMICGKVVKIISDSEDFTSSSEHYMFRILGEQRLRPMNGNLDNVEEAINKNVNIVGSIDKDQIFVNKMSFDPDPIRKPLDFNPNPDSIQEMVESNFSITSPPPTRYVRNVYVVRVKFQGDPNPSQAENDLQIQQLTSAWFTSDRSSSMFFRDASFQQFSLAGSVHPTWVEIPFPATNCENLMFSSWTDSIIAQLGSVPAFANANTVSVNFREIPGCTFNGNGSLGVKGALNGRGFIWHQMLPSLFANNSRLYIQTISHEVGHNLGLNHAGGFTVDGVYTDGGDIGDFMASRFRLPNLFTRFALGWTQGRFTIFSGPRAAPYQDMPWQVHVFPPDQHAPRLPNGRNGVGILLYNADGTLHDKMILLETRRDSTFDTFSPEHTGAVQGLGILLVDRDQTRSTAKSYRLDATPGTPMGWSDAFLPPAQSVTIPQFGLRIEARERNMMRGMQVWIYMTQGPPIG